MCNFDTIDYGTSWQSAGSMPTQLTAEPRGPSPSPRAGLFASSWADEVEQASKAKKGPVEETPGKEQENKAVDDSKTAPEEDKHVPNIDDRAYFTSRHADPEFKIPEKDDAGQVNWGASYTANTARGGRGRGRGTGGRGSQGRGNRGRGGMRGRKNGVENGGENGGEDTDKKTYPTKQRIKEADWQREYDRYLGNVKGFRVEQAMIDELVGAWMRALVVVLPDGREMPAEEYCGAGKTN